MKYTSPKISVLMSVYNGEKWLHDSIESILNQTISDYEFIIVNDGSIDNSLEIIKNYQKKDNRIIIVDKKNTGLADSLNQGIKIARGEWIARIDADDISIPTRLELQYEYTHKISDVIFVGSGMIQVDSFGNQIKKYNYPEKHKDLLSNLKLVKKFPPHSSAFYNTRIVKEIGGYRPRIERGQDWDLWLRLSTKGNLACLPDFLVCVRCHDEQISHKNSGRSQIYFSRMAIISFWLKDLDEQDPVEADDKGFLEFKTWLQKDLQNNNVFLYQDYINRLKLLAYPRSNSINAVISFLLYAFSRPRFIFKFLLLQISNNHMEKKMAYKWLVSKS
jgi:glycosyltransferase involved in cell wall biosynthesis